LREKKAKKERKRKKESLREVRRMIKEEKGLREVIVKIGLERINTQEEITVEALLDSEVTKSVISLEFVRKQGFKLKKMERPIYMGNIGSFFSTRRDLSSILL